MNFSNGVFWSFTAAAAFSRLLPHPPNFTAVASLVLFSAAAWDKPWQGLAAALLAMLLTDLILGLHSSLPAVYLALGIIYGIGMLVRKKINTVSVTAGAVSSSLVFYLITNFSVWLFSGMYPRTASGLAASYLAGIPFLGYTAAGDIFFSAVLFGGSYVFLKWRNAVPAHW